MDEIKPRGRPRTGTAQTTAERTARYRRRQADLAADRVEALAAREAALAAREAALAERERALDGSVVLPREMAFGLYYFLMSLMTDPDCSAEEIIMRHRETISGVRFWLDMDLHVEPYWARFIPWLETYDEEDEDFPIPTPTLAHIFET